MRFYAVISSAPEALRFERQRPHICNVPKTSLPPPYKGPPYGLPGQPPPCQSGGQYWTPIGGQSSTPIDNQIDAAAAERQNKTIEEVVKASRANIPVGRYGTVEEYAAVAAFLVSARAAYVTGSVVRVDGGFIRGV